MGPFFPVQECLSQIIYEINHIRPAGISNKWILAGKLQLKKLQKKKPEKKFRLRRGLNSCLPDTSWALYQLSYEATCWERGKFLVGPFFPVQECLSQIIYEINHIRPAGISNKWILAGKLQLKKLRLNLT